tara:strand:+ start:407 stop:907 length:501 start_codon:yes stop_codon:yes gene_type:complete
MNTISKILTGNLFWIIFFLFVVTSAQARNEYLNDGAYACEKGYWETYSEVRQQEYKTGTNDEYQNQMLGFRFRMPFGTVCDDEYIAEQKKKQKLKTQLELVKECKRVPRISPPPVEFAELINMCLKLGVTSTSYSDDRPDASVSYWTVLKDDWKKENPDRPVFEGQ